MQNTEQLRRTIAVTEDHDRTLLTSVLATEVARGICRSKFARQFKEWEQCW